MELENGETEWRMATSSTPGGSIPNFIVDSTMAKKISSVCHRRHIYVAEVSDFRL